MARFADGRILKGITNDFSPMKERFHLFPAGDAAAKAVEVALTDLKALFFVRTYEGNPTHVPKDGFEAANGHGRRVRITFNDGEMMAGFTTGYSDDKVGFFLLPADPTCNNARIFVVLRALRKLEWVPGPVAVLAGAGADTRGR